MGANTGTVQESRAADPAAGRWRVRWAAIGAAVAVALGAGGLELASATGGSDDTFVAITPCRLADTRLSTVGARDVPLGAGETAPFAVHGSNGDCVIPAAATGVVANVTAVSPTSDSFVTLFPADVERPNSSNLNLVAGAPATPNQVTVRVPTSGPSAGVVNVFNERGQVDLIIDLVGYVAGHDHDDRYYTQAEVDSALSDKADTAAVYTRDQIDALPSSSTIGGGRIGASGDVSTSHPRLGGDWTAKRVADGDYEIMFPGVRPDCDGPAFPIMLLSNILPGSPKGGGAWVSSVQCNPTTGDITVAVETFDETGALDDRSFTFIAYYPGPGQLTP